MQNPPGPRIATEQQGRIELNLNFNPTQLFLHALTPKIWVNGHQVTAHWGRQWFDMPPGPHRVAAAFPYLFSDRRCYAEVVAPVYSGHATIVNYQVPMFVFSAGTIHVVNTVPMNPYG